MITGVRSIIFASGEPHQRPQGLPGRWPTPARRGAEAAVRGRSRSGLRESGLDEAAGGCRAFPACGNPPIKPQRRAVRLRYKAAAPDQRHPETRQKRRQKWRPSAAVTIPNGRCQPTGYDEVDEPDRVFHSPQALGIDRFSLDLKLFDALFCRRANSSASISAIRAPHDELPVEVRTQRFADRSAC